MLKPTSVITLVMLAAAIDVLVWLRGASWLSSGGAVFSTALAVGACWRAWREKAE